LGIGRLEMPMTAMEMKSKSSPTVTIDKKHCKITPVGKIHAPGKKHRGYVVFHAISPCSILFTNPEVFGLQYLTLPSGHHKRFTKVDRGHTLVMIAGCEYRIPRSLGAASNPSDIVVP
jgi:hypothetical protein